MRDLHTSHTTHTSSHTTPSAFLRAPRGFMPALAIAVLACVSPAFADTASDVRYTDLLARLGAAAPTGAGIGVGQVEANEGTNFAPDH